jgi:hypothetical protein
MKPDLPRTPYLFITARVGHLPPGLSLEPGSTLGDCAACKAPVWVDPEAAGMIQRLGADRITCLCVPCVVSLGIVPEP